MQEVDKCPLVHMFVFISLLWFCHSEVHLSEEKPAALLQLAVAYLDPVGIIAPTILYPTVPQAHSDPVLNNS